MSNQLFKALHDEILNAIEYYRGTEHGKVVEGIGDAFLATLAAHEATKPESLGEVVEMDDGCAVVVWRDGTPEPGTKLYAAPVAQAAEPVAWPSAAEIADEIDALLPMSLGDSTMAAIEEWWRQLVTRKLSKIATPVAAARAPLTKDQVCSLLTAAGIGHLKVSDAVKAVRVIEQAHNIKEQA